MNNTTKGWALILGASSGFGEAAAIALAQDGFDIAGVHLDRRAAMPNINRIVDQIEAAGRRASFFNVNAADPDKRSKVVTALSEMGAQVTVLMHSLAFGTLRPFIAEDPKQAMSQAQMDMTVNVMAHSLVYWTQDLVARGLMGRGGRIFAMTSAGGTRVWGSYGAVSAAKAALESHVRQLALELAPRGITANAIRAGVTDTPALRKIPGNERLIENALAGNPAGRLTTTEDVASAIVLLSQPGAQWISGGVIGVDGGEDIGG